jgi:hypothetical protein
VTAVREVCKASGRRRDQMRLCAVLEENRYLRPQVLIKSRLEGSDAVNEGKDKGL